MPGPSDPTGKRALFSAPAAGGTATPRRPVNAGPSAGAGELRGRHTLFSAAGTQNAPPAPSSGPITLDCSSCGTTSTVNVKDFVLAHLPLFLWHPGKGYTRLMRCPACHRRTWISASLTMRSSLPD